MNDKTIHKERGSVMVEFAGALILLVMMVFGITEIGRAIYQLNTLTKSVEAGARYMSRAVDIITFDSSGMSSSEQCESSTNWDTAAQRATNIILYGTETAGETTRLPNMEVTSISVESHVDPVITHGGACVIKVNAKAKFVSIFGDDMQFLSFYGEASENSGGLTLTADTEERYIGE